VSIQRRILAIVIDYLVIFVPAFGLGLIAGLVQESVSGSAYGFSLFFLIAFPIIFLGQFAYQYRSLLTGKPTAGQAVAKFYVDAKVRSFEAGRFHLFLETIGVRIVSSKTTFWPATLHIVFATISMGLWPINLLLAALDSEKRFWWAKLSGTKTINMSGL
jgi:hypothetical protein